MAVKKTQLYASLWASCDKLRGGMDSSEYKDYILTLLFMKYVTDKFKNKGYYVTPIPTQHPYIRVADMRPGYVDVEGLMYVPDEAYFWIQKYRIYRDDIYISVAGTLGQGC